MKNNKRIFQRITNFISSVWASLLLDVILVVAFLLLGFLLNTEKSVWKVLSDVFTNGVTISVIIVEIVLLFNNVIKKACAIKLEESKKILDDYHAIIRKYSDYDNYNQDNENNYFSSKGALMTLNRFVDIGNNEKKLSKQYHAFVVNNNKEQGEEYLKELQGWDQRSITIPEVLVFANVDGKAKMIFDDNCKEFVLPEFVVNNSAQIMRAHDTSLYSNHETIRLCDVKYDRICNELTLVTCRTCYFDMLLTNRCMDYDLGGGITIRNKYEYRKSVLPLNETQLSNQIGIEGLIFSNDGWVLVEKRRKNERTTWRDKYGQPISFSMEKDELLNKNEKTLQPDAETHIKEMINKRLYKFGLNMGENESQYSFSLSDNFLGISRDLTEGGKPNMYFYVMVNCDHIKMKEILEDAAIEKKSGSASTKESPVDKKDMNRSYYLCDTNNIYVNYNYIMKLNNKNAVAVNRVRKDNFFKKIKSDFKKIHLMCSIEKECGESLIGCLAFSEICRNRIERKLNINNEKNANE